MTPLAARTGIPLRKRRGYTLLELLIILMITGLLAGIAVPRLYTLFESGSVATERDDILHQIGALGHRAWSEQKTLVLDAGESANTETGLLTMPSDWSLVVEEPVQYLANGVCLGGTVGLHYKDRFYTVALDPPLCKPVLL